MREILKKIQAHIPFRLLTTEHLHIVIEEGINPEISFNHFDLDNIKGNFPFTRLFAMLRERNLSPVITFEAHSEDNLRQTVQNIKKTNLLSAMCNNGNRAS